MLLFRIMTVIVQIYAILWVTNHLIDIDERPDNNMILVAIVAYLVNGVLFTYMNLGFYGKYLIIIVPLLVNIFVYNKNIFLSILGFALTYTFNVFVINGSLILTYYLYKLNNKSIDLRFSPLPYILIFFIYILAIITRKRIISFLNSIRSFKKQLSIPIVLVLILVMISADTAKWMILPPSKAIAMHNFWYSSIAILFVSYFFYLLIMREKAAKIKQINRNLTEKITELRKLKHDYGSEISGLYGLYKLGEYKRLEKMLKDIIDRYQTIDANEEMNFEASPIVKSLFSSIRANNIDIEIKDEGYYENIALSESELYKVLSNITKNAMEALSGIEGSLIRYKSYNGYKKLIIEIENTGQDVPRITEEALRNIYNPGYSTKGTQEERGYGLAIVKELMDRVGGRIFIESKKNITLFRLEIPRSE